MDNGKGSIDFAQSTIDSLHQVNVTEGVDVFIGDNASDYKVIIPFNATPKLVEAAEFFADYCEKATGVRLVIENAFAGEWNEDCKWIIFGCDNLFVAAGLIMPQQDIGATGYYIKTVGKSVFVAVNGEHAYRRAVLCLLHHILGYERYAADTIVFEKESRKLPVMDIVERPDFDFYTDLDGFSGDGYYGMGFDHPIYIPTGNVGHFHNSFVLLPPDLYAEKHPAWYGETKEQLCYTAHGDKEEYSLMVKTMAESLIKYIESDPDKCNITMTQEDNWALCECEACRKSREKYDGANSAAIIKFTNAVDNAVQDYFQKKAEALGGRKREINIVFFAYQNTEKPPVRECENGDYFPIDDSVICNKNVGVYIAPIIAKYHKSFYDEINIDAARNMRQWGACCKKLHVWLYDTNYAQYLFPFNTFETIVDTYRFCKNVGAYYMLVEGQHNQDNAPGFMKLKDYLNSKALFDLNCDYNKILDDFFCGIFWSSFQADA